MSAVDAVDGFPMREVDVASQRSMSMSSAVIKDLQESPVPLTHAEDFKRRTGMTPKHCYRLVLLSLCLRLMGGCWIGMVGIEYARYYVINDLALFDTVRTATGSPQYAIQAFLFPFWGVVSDRVSRKKIVALASLATCMSAWSFTIAPCVGTFILTKVLALVADVGGPIRDAMLRDILTTDEWEKSSGGVTGVKARLFLIGQIAFGVGTGVGMGLLKLGEYGYALPNEYTVHKDECGKMYCLPDGHQSWDGPWKVDGCLRLLMIMGSVVMTIDACVVCFLFPETLPPEFRRETTLWAFLKVSWREAGKPWNNLRILATHQLRSLMAIRFLGYIVAAGGGSIFMSFYNRFQFDTFTMTLHSVIAGAATWFTTAAVSRLVDRYGDLKGIWLPGKVLCLCYGISCAFLPAGYGYMVFAIWPTFAGTSFALEGIAPELLAKLIPGEFQGTYQTAKSFIFRLTMAVFAWPWNQVFVHTSKLSYPFDGICIFISIAIGFVALYLTLRKLRNDPRDAISAGRALEAFWDSPYGKKLQGDRDAAAAAAQEAGGAKAKAATEPRNATAPAEATKEAEAAKEEAEEAKEEAAEANEGGADDMPDVQERRAIAEL
uniref:Major facilitator superfamily (MFS) profile domain-containing protein n=1 Tax=Alexandrium catenella TaxID=2925 RepID=A0A7S1SF84_ALECA